MINPNNCARCEQVVFASGDTLADVSGRKLQDLLEKSQRRGRHPIAASSVVAIQCAAVWTLFPYLLEPFRLLCYKLLLKTCLCLSRVFW